MRPNMDFFFATDGGGTSSGSIAAAHRSARESAAALIVCWALEDSSTPTGPTPARRLNEAITHIIFSAKLNSSVYSL